MRIQLVGGTPSYAARTLLEFAPFEVWEITAPEAGQARARLKVNKSVSFDADGLVLVGDVTTPGNLKYYGTNGAGVRGFFALPTPYSPPVIGSGEIVYGTGGGLFGSTPDLTRPVLGSLLATVDTGSALYPKWRASVTRGGGALNPGEVAYELGVLMPQNSEWPNYLGIKWQALDVSDPLVGGLILGNGLEVRGNAKVRISQAAAANEFLVNDADGLVDSVSLSGLGALLGLANFLLAANNLSDLTNLIAARANLGLGSSATRAYTDFLQVANDLNDLHDASAARNNLGLGSSAVRDVTYFLQSANNLFDLPSPSTARTNLGLGSAATHAAADFEVPLTFTTNAVRTGNTVDVGTELTITKILGFGLKGVVDVDPAGTVSIDIHPALKAFQNLADLDNVATAMANLNAASLAGNTFTATQHAPTFKAEAAGGGSIQFVAGDALHSGHVDFYMPDGTTRRGYMGYDTVDVSVTLENGSHFRVSGGHIVQDAAAVPTGGGHGLVQPVVSAPTGVQAGTGVVYWKTVGSVSRLFAQGSDNVEHQLT